MKDMGTLPESRDIYCDVVKQNVTCRLQRDGFGGLRADVYVCSRIGSEEKTCNPCMHYVLGRFVPVHSEALKADGSLDLKKWLGSIRATVELPVSRFL